MKQQPNPQVVDIEVISPLKDKGQNLLEGVVKAHVCDLKQEGQHEVVKPPHARKELDLDNVCEDDANEEDDNANSKVDDIEVDEYQDIESGDEKLDFPPKKKKKNTNQVQNNGKDHDGFKK
jgi:hypothetical protein